MTAGGCWAGPPSGRRGGRAADEWRPAGCDLPGAGTGVLASGERRRFDAAQALGLRGAALVVGVVGACRPGRGMPVGGRRPGPHGRASPVAAAADGRGPPVPAADRRRRQPRRPRRVPPARRLRHGRARSFERRRRPAAGPRHRRLRRRAAAGGDRPAPGSPPRPGPPPCPSPKGTPSASRRRASATARPGPCCAGGPWFRPTGATARSWPRPGPPPVRRCRSARLSWRSAASTTGPPSRPSTRCAISSPARRRRDRRRAGRLRPLALRRQGRGAGSGPQFPVPARRLRWLGLGDHPGRSRRAHRAGRPGRSLCPARGHPVRTGIRAEIFEPRFVDGVLDGPDARRGRLQLRRSLTLAERDGQAEITFATPPTEIVGRCERGARRAALGWKPPSSAASRPTPCAQAPPLPQGPACDGFTHAKLDVPAAGPALRTAHLALDKLATPWPAVLIVLGLDRQPPLLAPRALPSSSRTVDDREPAATAAGPAPPDRPGRRRGRPDAGLARDPRRRRDRLCRRSRRAAGLDARAGEPRKPATWRSTSPRRWPPPPSWPGPITSAS
jgi:hypothetical protein